MTDLVIGKVLTIEDYFEGKRVLLDFMDEFDREDYILVGNTMAGFIPLVSENHYSNNYKPRSFRFNAGALHQYILVEDNKVKYIDELEIGDRIQVHSKGCDQYFPIGRKKKEIRSFVKLTAAANGKRVSVIVQKGETICVLSTYGIKKVSDLHIGDEIYLSLFGKASHLGNVIDEDIEED